MKADLLVFRFIFYVAKANPIQTQHAQAYLEVILAMYCEAMAEYIPGDDHVGLHAIHREPVHAQELWQQCVAMTLHYELRHKLLLILGRVGGWGKLMMQ